MSRRAKTDDTATAGFEQLPGQENGGPKTVKVPRHKLPVDHPDYESLATKFRRLANRRVPALIKRMNHVKALSVKGQYSYTTEEAEKIIKAVAESFAEMASAFRGGVKTKETWSL